MQEKKTHSRGKMRTVCIGQHRISTHGLIHNFWVDLYHYSMTVSWLRFLSGWALLFVALNILFALAYWLVPGSVAEANRENFLDYLFFSVETLSTVGYGDMYPTGTYGRVLSTIEIFAGMSFITLAMGLVFARFSRPQAHLIFARHPVIGLHDGAPALMLRIANARHSDISDARVKLWLVRTEKTAEGISFRRYFRLQPAQDENPVFILSWTIIHMIDETSPLHGLSPEEMKKTSANLVVSVSGLDENTAEDVHVRKIYSPSDIRMNHQYVDLVESEAEGHTLLNYEKFHDIVPTGKSDVTPARVVEK